MARTAYRTSAQVPDSAPDVRAAGCLCWRPSSGGGIEVLVIHRPRYDDWSWPKGKLEAEETLPEAAYREVHEEVGLKVRLGAPLPVMSYKVKCGMKHVYYWTAEISPFSEARADGKEVDELRWVTPERAVRMLSNTSDLVPLRRLVELHNAGDLAVRPAIVVRHAKAKPRSSWSRAEGDRPLAATGKRQALAVTRLLTSWSPERVLSSPWLRCLSTVTPYAKNAGLKVKERPALTEAAHKRSPKKAAAVVETLFDKDRPVVLCTHRPVLPTVLKVLGRHMPADMRSLLPEEDPYLAPGELIVLQVSRRHRHRVVSAEIVRPFDS
ncbi:NUDIX hydrolase [Kocuria coralli]|uniref:NUDIX hydrolase n=1 Tax=Kocuria coralli TaxID=1461025 RepID=A0A5J5L2B7_9MICC|nr:NUDIX hydrolase [Kocuria coralli]KAA9395236.1 NUDIX hydrolase [Kocuria coralli]